MWTRGDRTGATRGLFPPDLGLVALVPGETIKAKIQEQLPTIEWFGLSLARVQVRGEYRGLGLVG